MAELAGRVSRLKTGDVQTTLSTLSYAGKSSVLEFCIAVFSTFDGKDGKDDLRGAALSALGFLEGSEAKKFLKKTAEKERGNFIGDLAVDAMCTAGPSVIPFLLSFYEHPGTCLEARISTLNTLANVVKHYAWNKRPIPPKYRPRITKITKEALGHENPYIRAFGCRLASSARVCLLSGRRPDKRQCHLLRKRHGWRRSYRSVRGMAQTQVTVTSRKPAGSRRRTRPRATTAT